MIQYNLIKLRPFSTYALRPFLPYAQIASTLYALFLWWCHLKKNTKIGTRRYDTRYLFYHFNVLIFETVYSRKVDNVIPKKHKHLK